MSTNTHHSNPNEFSGDLAAKLADLEQGRANGTVDPNRLLTHIAAVREVARRMDLDPWRARGEYGVLITCLCLAAWNTIGAFPDLSERLGFGQDVALAAGILALVCSAWCFMIYFRLRKASQAWFKGLEATVQKGGAIVDYLQDGKTAS